MTKNCTDSEMFGSILVINLPIKRVFRISGPQIEAEGAKSVWWRSWFTTGKVGQMEEWDGTLYVAKKLKSS